jgi:glycosyltransferase involved in cell wall biosynthesis
VFLLGLRDDVQEVLLAGDVFVQPSRSEGLPLAILEAMGAGLPVVATRVGGVGEAIVDGESGLLVPAQSPSALTEALDRLFEAPQEAERMASSGQRRAIEEFSASVMASRYRDLYGRVGSPSR